MVGTLCIMMYRDVSCMAPRGRSLLAFRKLKVEPKAEGDGGWRMADGGWRMADGGWRMAGLQGSRLHALRYDYE